MEFYNKYHPDPNEPKGEQTDLDDQFPDGMFRFEKVMKRADREDATINFIIRS